MDYNFRPVLSDSPAGMRTKVKPEMSPLHLSTRLKRPWCLVFEGKATLVR